MYQDGEEVTYVGADVH